ncbi:MAG: ribosome silencing factor [Phycisphaerales bacterium]|nr:ribosome silencing factor [Phycisphaerales bacterium]
MKSIAPEQFAVELARLADDFKCDDVTVMDLRGRSTVADFFLIAGGTSDRQLRGAAEAIREYARKVGERPYSVTGFEAATWILVDFVDIVVHLFMPDQRRYYDLELLWGDAPRLQWVRVASA